MLRTYNAIEEAIGKENKWGLRVFLAGISIVTWLPAAALATAAVVETAVDGAKLLGRAAKKTAKGGKVLVDKALEARRIAAEKKRAEEEEAKKPKPLTKTQVRQALRELYFDLLEEIDLDPLMDETEKEAAREKAKQNFLNRMNEVM